MSHQSPKTYLNFHLNEWLEICNFSFNGYCDIKTASKDSSVKSNNLKKKKSFKLKTLFTFSSYSDLFQSFRQKLQNNFQDVPKMTTYSRRILIRLAKKNNSYIYQNFTINRINKQMWHTHLKHNWLFVFPGLALIRTGQRPSLALQNITSVYPGAASPPCSISARITFKGSASCSVFVCSV